jgi:hypothetical protein
MNNNTVSQPIDSVSNLAVVYSARENLIKEEFDISDIEAKAVLIYMSDSYIKI